MTEVQAQPVPDALTGPEVTPELDEFLNWTPASSDVAACLGEAKQLVDEIHRLSDEHKFEELLLACSKVSRRIHQYSSFNAQSKSTNEYHGKISNHLSLSYWRSAIIISS